MSSNRQSPVHTALIRHFSKKYAQFRFFLPEIRPPQTFLRISPYPQKNAFLRITLAVSAYGPVSAKPYPRHRCKTVFCAQYKTVFCRYKCPDNRKKPENFSGFWLIMNSTASQTAAVSGFGYCVVLGPLPHATR